MKKKIELKVVSSTAFAKVINEVVDESNGTINHYEACLLYTSPSPRDQA